MAHHTAGGMKVAKASGQLGGRGSGAAAAAAPAAAPVDLPPFLPLLLFLFLQAWYFLYFSALSCLFPFLNLFFRRLGYSAKQIGIIGCLRPLVRCAVLNALCRLAAETACG